MKSFLICLIVAAGFTLGFEAAFGDPAAGSATSAPAAYQDCEKLESQPQAYAACEDLQQKLSPQDKPSDAPSSPGGGYSYSY